MSLEIRLAKAEDIREILDIYGPYILNTDITFEYEIPSEDAFKQRFQNITQKFPWLVCETKGRIAGYAYADITFARAAYQWDADLAVYIRPEYQRKGLARAFYNCIEDILRMQGYINLYALVTSANETSREFHRRMGYRECAHFDKMGYKRGKWHGVTWFEKQLKEYEDNPQPPVPFPQLAEESVAAVLNQFS